MIREGRLGRHLDERVAPYVASTDFDINILTFDLFNDMAHVIMLAEAKIIGRDEAGRILKGLKDIYESRDDVKLEPDAEDVHLAIEEILTKKIGDVAGKMHTARSRNDQVACDLRMWLREEVNSLSSLIIEFASILLEKASKHADTIMPGYTHLQRGQPTTLGHQLVAHADAILRDLERLEDSYARINLNPLGAGAFAATSFPIARKRTTQLLGFDGVAENSMDAVAARDFILELQACLSITMTGLARIAEEIILWTTSEFGFAELSDEVATTSSIMPQKKNPDVLELLRARSGKVSGNLLASLAITKGLPMGYNRDFQELNPLLSDSIKTAKYSLAVLGKVVKDLGINEARMREACLENFITATDLADMIVREKNIPFRKAHQIVGAAVAKAVKEGLKSINSKMLDDAASNVMGSRLNLSDDSVKAALSPVVAVESRVVLGGPAPKEVKRMIATRKQGLLRRRADLKDRARRIESARKMLLSTVHKMAGAGA